MISNLQITRQLIIEKNKIADTVSRFPVTALRLFHEYEQHHYNKRTVGEKASGGLLGSSLNLTGIKNGIDSQFIFSCSLNVLDEAKFG